MDADTAQRIRRRLRIIEGQLRGIQRLLDEEAPCTAVMTQIAAVQNALRGIGRNVVRHHLATCVASDIKRGQGDRHYDELLDIMTKLVK